MTWPGPPARDKAAQAHGYAQQPKSVDLESVRSARREILSLPQPINRVRKRRGERRVHVGGIAQHGRMHGLARGSAFRRSLIRQGFQ